MLYRSLPSILHKLLTSILSVFPRMTLIYFKRKFLENEHSRFRGKLVISSLLEKEVGLVKTQRYKIKLKKLLH